MECEIRKEVTERLEWRKGRGSWREKGLRESQNRKKRKWRIEWESASKRGGVGVEVIVKRGLQQLVELNELSEGRICREEFCRKYSQRSRSFDSRLLRISGQRMVWEV